MQRNIPKASQTRYKYKLCIRLRAASRSPLSALGLPLARNSLPYMEGIAARGHAEPRPAGLRPGRLAFVLGSPGRSGGDEGLAGSHRMARGKEKGPDEGDEAIEPGGRLARPKRFKSEQRPSEEMRAFRTAGASCSGHSLQQAV